MAKAKSYYVKILNSFGIKYFILGFWLVALGFSGWLGPRFLTSTTNKFESPAGTESYIAQKVMESAFNKNKTVDFAIFIYSNDNTSSVLGEDLKNWTLELNRTIYTFSCDNCVQQFVSYYTLLADGLLPQIATQLLGPENKTMIIELETDFPAELAGSLIFAQSVQKAMTQLKPINATWSAELTGIAAFLPLIQNSMEKDFALMDGIALPLAMIILGLILKSLRLLILPLVTMGVSALTSFMVMYFCTYLIEIVAFAPSLMMSLLVAMSIDYSLFLLSRYREELLSGKTTKQAVIIMLSSAGSTVFISGLTLCGSFAGLIVIPLNLMQSLGLACALTLVILVIVNLTIVPCLLLSFPNFFANCVQPMTICGYVFEWGSIDENGNSVAEKQSLRTKANMTINDPFATTPVLPEDGDYGSVRTMDDIKEIVENGESLHFNSQAYLQYQEAVTSQFWYILGKINLTFPYNLIILIIVIGCVLPISIPYAYNYRSSDGVDMMMPFNSPFTDVFTNMVDIFGYGRVFPYEILLIPQYNGDRNGSIISQRFFKESNALLNEMVEDLGYNISRNDFSGFINPNLTWFEYNIAHASCISQPNGSICKSLNFAIKNFVNSHVNATFLLLNLKSIDPLGNYGDVFYKKLLRVSRKLSADYNISIYVSGLPAASMDAIDAANGHFMEMIGITSGIILVFVAISFRSFFLPIRSIFTIIITLGFVYGLATLVYEKGAFNFLHFQGLKGYGAVYWAPPLISFSIIAGLGLDYDVFLLSRIREYRYLGYSNKESVILGLSKTGHIITAAGFIMAIAFSGLLFSNIAVMNMLSFFLSFAVVFDTFIVRTFIVPSIMGFFGDFNWWPGSPPPVSLYHDTTESPELCGGLLYNFR